MVGRRIGVSVYAALDRQVFEHPVTIVDSVTRVHSQEKSRVSWLLVHHRATSYMFVVLASPPIRARAPSVRLRYSLCCSQESCQMRARGTPIIEIEIGVATHC